MICFKVRQVRTREREQGPIVAGCAKCGATRFVGPWIYDKGRAPFLCERCDPNQRR